jgi:hypothetical protein
LVCCVGVRFAIRSAATYDCSAAALSPQFFGVNPVPDSILTTPNSTSQWTVVNVMANTSDGNNVYKIFSNTNMTMEQLDIMFLNMTTFQVQYWPFTFPDLAPTASYQPIFFDENILYLNGIESVAVGMGASTPAGRNAALLISSSINSKLSVDQ